MADAWTRSPTTENNRRDRWKGEASDKTLN